MSDSQAPPMALSSLTSTGAPASATVGSPRVNEKYSTDQLPTGARVNSPPPAPHQQSLDPEKRNASSYAPAPGASTLPQPPSASLQQPPPATTTSTATSFAGLVNKARMQQNQPSSTPAVALDPANTDDGPVSLQAISGEPGKHSMVTSDTAASAASGSQKVSLAKLLNKRGVDAAAAFSRATASTRQYQNETVPIQKLTVASCLVPGMFLRSDDKGRRPPPCIFQALKLAITDSEIYGGGKQLIFRVELQYGEVKWVLRRTQYEFYKLHLSLSARRFENLPKFPSQTAYAYNMVKANLGMREEERHAFVKKTNLERRKALEVYLLGVLEALNWTVSYDLYEFLEISCLSLTKDMGWKAKEGLVETKVVDTSGGFCGLSSMTRWDKSWAVLRDSYMAFIPNVGSSYPTDVIMFDANFYVKHMEGYGGLNLHHIEIGNTHRRIEIKGDHNRNMLEWMESFNKIKETSPWVRKNRFDSFAPQREEAKVRYYVDGKDYFYAVSDAIMAAKNEIYICDWWLSPEMYLRRPPAENEEYRLDRLLKKKAEEGVMIYIVVYKEIAMALTLDSAHTKIWLQGLHHNIQVQRHPDHLAAKSTQFWAHHEKICVIDCRMAFIGGLDLCFGRYDSHSHQLSDYHPDGSLPIWPGVDYSNPRVKDFVNVQDFNAELIDKRITARMPWHDVSIGVAGPPARDIARHFVQRWNFVKKEKGMKKSKEGMKFLTPKGEYVSTRNERGWEGSCNVQILRSSTLWSQGVELECSIMNAYIDSIGKAEHFIYIENQFFVTLAVENGNPDIKNLIGKALVDRIVRAHQEQKKFRIIVVMPLMPAFEADVSTSEAATLKKVMHFQYVSICRGGNSVLERLVAMGINPDDYIAFFGLRSFDRIKHGKFDAVVDAVKQSQSNLRAQEAKQGQQGAVPPRDAGIPTAFQAANMVPHHDSEGDLHAIAATKDADATTTDKLKQKVGLDKTTLEQAKEEQRLKEELEQYNTVTTGHSAYSSHDSHSTVNRPRGLNPIADAQVDSEAIIEPGMGAIGGGSAAHRKNSNNSGPNVGPTGENPPEPNADDIVVTPGLGTENPIVEDEKYDFVTEQLYIHTKLMIVDDRIIICGSANLNDRSQVGFRDSEIAIIIEDKETVDITMNGQPWKANKKAHELRVELFKEHLGLLDHVDFDVVTRGSILPVDLSAPETDLAAKREQEIAIATEKRKVAAAHLKELAKNGAPNTVRGQANRLVNLARKALSPHAEGEPTMTAGGEAGEDAYAAARPAMPSGTTADSAKALLANTEDAMAPNGGGRVAGDATVPNQIPVAIEIEDVQGWHQDDPQRVPEVADKIVMDPLHDDFYLGWWKKVANQNTLIFRDVFHCVPDDTVTNWTEYKAFVPNPQKVMTGHVALPESTTVEAVTDKLKGVMGHLVEFPLNFLNQENLLGGVVEGKVTPMEIFT